MDTWSDRTIEQEAPTSTSGGSMSLGPYLVLLAGRLARSSHPVISPGPAAAKTTIRDSPPSEPHQSRTPVDAGFIENDDSRFTLL